MRGLDWLRPLQVLEVSGDWAEQRPDVRPGGWAFQYRNDYYPDLDDTAVVVMAMDRARRHREQATYDEAIDAASNGRWACRAATAAGAPSMPTTSIDYLNNIPFADHGALLDPPTADVSARCISMLAQLGTGGGSSGAAGRARLSRTRAGGRRQLVRSLGRELHLRHLVGAVCAQRCGPGHDAPEYSQRGRLAGRRFRIPTADGEKTAQATISTIVATNRRRPTPRRPPGRCSG